MWCAAADVLEILFLVNMEFQLNLILRNAFDVQSSILDKIEEFKMIYFKTRVNRRGKGGEIIKLDFKNFSSTANTN